MEKTNHPVDNIFSKGLSDFQVAPLDETKKKIFASPAAIKPIKLWYIASKNIIIISSALLVSSFLFYYFFFDYSTKEIVNNAQNNIVANTINTNSVTTNIQKNDINNNSHNKGTDIKNNIKITNDLNKIKNNTANSSANTNPVDVSKDENNGVSHTSTPLSMTNSINKQDQGKQLSMTTPLNETKNNTKKSSVNTNIAPVNQSVPENKTNASTSLSVTITLDKQTNTTNNNNIANKQLNNNSTQNVTTNTNYSSANNVKPDIANNQNYGVNISANANFGVNSHLNNNLVTQNSDEEPFSFLLKRTIPYINNGISSEFLFSNKESEYHLKGLWFVEVKAGGMVSNYKVKGKDAEWDNAAQAKQDLLATSFGYDVQLNAVHQRNNWIIKGGLSYVNYGETIKGNALLTNPHNKTNINFNNGPYDVIIGGNYYLIDTIGNYYHYTYTQTDHIYKSDSTLAWETQNVLADVWDTTNVTLFDSLPKTKLNNSIRYVEIPLSVGYFIPYGRFTVGINATVTPGYFLNVKGSNMNAEQYPAIEPYQKSIIKKFTLSAGAELELGYQINERLMVCFSPFYKKSLFPMYNDGNPINQKVSHYGFRVGIRKLL
jgi:hypothetical protein